MITANFIHRTFRIRCGNAVGTAFTIDVDDRQYLVTARHVLSQFDQHGVQIMGNGEWMPVPFQLVGHGPRDVDISVLAASTILTPAGLPVEPSSAGATYGQDLYFLGFPYHFLGNIVFTERGYPLPFVKRATLSCFDADVYLLDGHNNPGFSGGPVVFGTPGVAPSNIAAVISGYKYVPEPVFAPGGETGLMYKYNTGIIVSHKIEDAVSLIRARPIGPLV